MKRVGIDIDGCLADFNEGYRRILTLVNGEDRFNGELDPPCWSYEAHYGYTKDDVRQAWKHIIASPNFWYSLAPYDRTRVFLLSLYQLTHKGDFYFITTRPNSSTVKGQTERWLTEMGYRGFPTALIARESKGLLAAGLGLTHFLDDKPENCFEVKTAQPDCEVYLLSHRYNLWSHEQCRAFTVKVDGKDKSAPVNIISSLDEFYEVVRA